MLKFGLEIEFTGLNGRSLPTFSSDLRDVGFRADSEGYHHEVRSYWKLVPDGSVSNGGEMVSPPLPFDSESLAVVERAYSALAACGARESQECGTHVHVDLTWLREYSRANQDAFLRFLVAAFQASEPTFDMLCKAHRANAYYCRSTVGKSYSEIKNDRYHKINLQSYTLHGTVEFRQLHGTMNAKAVKAWITLCVTFVSNARKRFEAMNGIGATPAALSA